MLGKDVVQDDVGWGEDGPAVVLAVHRGHWDDEGRRRHQAPLGEGQGEAAAEDVQGDGRAGQRGKRPAQDGRDGDEEGGERQLPPEPGPVSQGGQHHGGGRRQKGRGGQEGSAGENGGGQRQPGRVDPQLPAHPGGQVDVGARAQHRQQAPQEVEDVDAVGRSQTVKEPGGRGVHQHVEVGPEREPGRVLPRLLSGSVQQQVGRLPIVEGLVAVRNGAADSGRQADGGQQLQRGLLQHNYCSTLLHHSPFTLAHITLDGIQGLSLSPPTT